MTSYKGLLNKIEAFCNAHLQIKKYGGEFKEQMPNFSTENEKYPIVYVVPASDLSDLNTNQFTLDVYCVDIIQKDRTNINTIVSDCNLIVNDLYLYFLDGNDLSIDVIGASSGNPLNNFDLDYSAGWVKSITFEVQAYSVCAIPMNPISPNPPLVCDNAVQIIEDIEGNELYNNSIPSGATETQVIQDSTYTVEYVNGTLIESGSILAEGSVTVQVPNPVTCEDATVNVNGAFWDSVPSGGTENVIVRQSSGSTQVGSIQGQYFRIADSTVENSDSTYSSDVVAEGSLVLPDITVNVKNTLGTTVNTGSYPSVTDVDISAPDATINNSNNTFNLSVPSGTTETLSDETILIYDENDVLVDTITYPALDNYEVFLDSYCPAPTPPTYASAELMKTGQTTSYRTGDDGDFEAGRGASFLTLLANNPFGNTNRFTDILGGQTYATAIVIDWSTYDGVSVLGYTKALNTVNVDWNGAVDGALATSISTFTSGWRLTNVNELGNIVAYGGVTLTCLNYAPFNIQDDRLVWSSTTAPFGATTAFTLATGNGVQNVLAKTSAFCRYIACRNFTVTGTTLS